MDTNVLETTGQIAGIGGIALGVFFLLARKIIAKKIFPTLSPKQGYRLLTLLVILAWSVALAGLATYLASKYLEMYGKTPKRVNIYQNSPLPPLSEEVVPAIIDTLFPNPAQASIFAHKIIKASQTRPLLFLVWETDNARYFSVIKNVNEHWERIWEYRDESGVFGASSPNNIVYHDEDQLIMDDPQITFVGHFPHDSASWGLLIYSTMRKSGWAVRCRAHDQYTVNSRFDVDFPLDFPEDLWLLFKYERRLNSYMDGALNLSHSDSYTEIFRHLPGKRIIPPLFDVEIPEYQLKQLPRVFQDKTKMSIDRLFCGDTDGDGSLEWIVIYGDSPTTCCNACVVKGDTIFDLPDSDGVRPLFIARYPVPHESPYLLFGGYGGSAGCPFGAVYRWDGSKYQLRPEMKETMMREFKMHGVEKCPEEASDFVSTLKRK